MKKWILAAIALPVAAVATIYGVGAVLPRDHVASRDATIAAGPDRVAGLVRAVEDQPKWRGGVTSIEVLDRSDRRLRYRETSGDGDILFDFSEERPRRQFRSRIADPDLPFGGAWTIRLSPAAGGTRVSIEERGSVGDPLYRFFSALVFGHTSTIGAYLADLKRAAEAG